MGEPHRLTPTMRSRKLQALDVIRSYFARWGHSPSLDEIGAELGISKQRARELVERLSDEQMIRRIAGKRRGIVLIDRAEELTEKEVLQRLQSLGWSIAPDTRTVQSPLAGVFEALTKTGLTELPELDHE